jgi:hypothetical protein
MFTWRAILSALGFSENLLMQADTGQRFQPQAVLFRTLIKRF